MFRITKRNIEIEIKLLEKELEKRRNEVSDMKRRREPVGMDKDSISVFSLESTAKREKQYRKILNLNSPTELQNEIVMVGKKVEAYKKKINGMKNVNKTAQVEVDKYRKEINTLKEHTDNITQDLV